MDIFLHELIKDTNANAAAEVDAVVVNNASGFTLTDIYIVNYNNAGHIAPAWSIADGSLLTALPIKPMIPGSTIVQTGLIKALEYPIVGGNASLTGEFTSTRPRPPMASRATTEGMTRPYA